MSKIENYIQTAINIANDNSHGYSQYKRWGNPDYDCSSLVITVIENSGIPVKTNGATYTGNMYNAFIRSGFKDVTNTVNLTTGQGLQRGDILLNTINHTEIYIGNGKNVGARGSENNTIHGVGGDQTGREIGISNYYNYPWNYVLRYIETVQQTTNNSNVNEYVEYGTFTATEDIYFRNEPNLNGKTQGMYYKGESVNYDRVRIDVNGFVWISWISSGTGIRRWMPTGETNNGKRSSSAWGTFR